MSNDKTLATAKHGGCVQLPTSERVKFDAWLEARSVDTTRWGDGEYTDPAAHNYWLAWQAALSAQPSPGGRDASELVFALPTEIANLDGSSAAWVKRDEVIEALAARQPVGEPVCTDCTTPLLYECPGCSKMNYPEPAQAMDLGAVRNAVQGITLGFDGDLPYIKGIAEALALIDSQAVGK